MNRICSKLLALLLILSLLPLPAAWADESTILITPSRETTSVDPGVPLAFTANQAVYWSIDKTDIATINTSEKTNAVTVTGRKPGEATLTASTTTEGAGSVVTRKVQVSGLVIPSTMSIYAGRAEVITPQPYGLANASKLTWTNSNSTIATISNTTNRITGFDTGVVTLTCTDGTYTSNECVVTVTENAAAISASLTNGKLNFSDILSQLNSGCFSETGQSLWYLTGLTVPTDQGVLYDRHVSSADTGAGVASSDRYYYSSGEGSLHISDLTFSPAAGFTGEAEITFTAFSTGSSYTGKIKVSVTSRTATEIAYSSAGEPIRFSVSDFNNYSLSVQNRSIQYVTFSLPNSRYGALYYNYYDSDVYDSAVTSGARYYASSSPNLGNVTFVPRSGYRGTFTISFTGYTAESSFRSTIRVSVSDDGSSAGSSRRYYDSDELVYYVEPGQRVYLDADDFNDYSLDESDYNFDYVRFTSLPSSSRGTLYYNGGNTVTTGLRFYRSGSGNLLEDVSFRANSNYEGTVSIPFTLTPTRGGNVTGYVEFQVGDDYDDYYDNGRYSSSSTSLYYSSAAGQRVYFNANDFSNASYDRTGRQLDYVRFTTLPASSRGVLYYGSGSRVTTGANYYRAGSTRPIDEVYFVPYSSFSGTVSIPYAGYNSSGTRFTGYIYIDVTSSGSYLAGLYPNSRTTTTTTTGVTGSTGSTAFSYSTSGAAVSFNGWDFSNAASRALGSVSTVRISTPDRNAGRLYLNYASPSQYTEYPIGREFALSEVNQISFVPKFGYQGSTSLAYTASDSQGNTYSGTFRIQITLPTASTYFSDMNGVAWAVPAADFFRRYDTISGTSATTFGPYVQARRGDYILMLSRVFSLPGAGTSSFSDVPQDSYYAAAIASARSAGVLTGDSSGKFNPEGVLTRQDAAVFLYRCMRRAGSVPAGTASDLARFSDRGQVASYAVEAVGSLVRQGLLSGDGYGHLNPTSPLNRAEMATLLYNAIT